jgi:hypothetical protein
MIDLASEQVASSASSSDVDFTAHWNHAMSVSKRWVEGLRKRQAYLQVLLPQNGGVSALERWCTTWSELADVLFKCHKVDSNKPLRHQLYDANALERVVVEGARAHEELYVNDPPPPPRHTHTHTHTPPPAHRRL